MLVFPSNPNTGDRFGQWMWDGDKWTRAGSAGFMLEALADVSISDPSQGQMLTWDAVIEKWMNTAPLALASLSDVRIQPPVSDGEMLAWNAVTLHWENITLPPATLANLTDVTLSEPSAGQLLTYNGSQWVNSGNAVITSGGLWELLELKQTTTGAGAMIRAQNSVGNTASFGINSNAQGVIRTNNIDRISVDQAGKVTIAAPNGDTGAGALNVNARANEWGEIIGGNPYGLYVSGSNNSAGYCAQFRNDFFGNLLLLQNDGSGSLGRNMTWSSTGNFIINAPTTGQPLTVYGLLDIWSLVVNGNPLGLIHRGKVAFQDPGANYNYFTIETDGSGMLGPPASRFIWDSGGRFSINNAPIAGAQLRVQGGSNNTAIRADAGWSTLSNVGWAGYFTNVPSNTGCANGVYIQAGTNRSDWPFRIIDAPGNALLAIDGYGFWDISLPAASGYTSFTIWTPNPAGSNLMQIVGTPYNQVRFPNAQPTASQYNTAMVVVSNLNQLCYFTSSARHKQDIRSLQRARARELLGKLRAVTFRSKCEMDDPAITHCGLIAEEVASVDPALASYDSDGLPIGVSYDEIMAMVVSILQELLGMEEQPC